MLHNFWNGKTGTSRKERILLFCEIGFGTFIMFFGGIAYLMACLNDSEMEKSSKAVKMLVPLVISDNDPKATNDYSEKNSFSDKTASDPLTANIKSKAESGKPALSESASKYHIYPGRVFAFKKSILTFRVSGPLLKIEVVPGQTVKKGDVLMQIDPRDYKIQVDLAQSRLDAARANLDAMRKGARPEDVALLRAKVEEAEATYTLAEKEFQRAKKLVDSKTISASEFDTANRACILASLACNSTKKELEKGLAGARVEDIKAAEAEIRGLEASLAATKNSLDDTTLRAPYDGVITTKMIEEHEMVTTTPTYRNVLGIHDISRLKVEIYVPEREMIGGRIQTGQTVSVRFTVKRENVYEAKLAEIDTEPSEVGMTYKLTFVMDRPKDLPILPGMISEVSLPELSLEK